MKKQLVTISIVFIFLLSACSKMPNHAKYVPKNALFVGTIDMSQLSKKLIWNAITGSELFDDMLKDLKNEDSKKAAKDMSNIGLDQNSTVYYYYTGSLKADGKAAVVIGMKEERPFENFIKKTYPTQTIKTNKDYKTCLIEESIIVAWNKEVAMVFPTTKKSNMELTEGMSSEDSAGTVVSQMTNNFKVNSVESMNAYLKEAFSLTKENSMVSVSNFGKLQKENHDMSFWMNYEELYKGNKNLTSGIASAFIKDEYFNDAALAAGIDFEKGAIDAEMDYYMSKDLAEIYGKYSSENINSDLVKNIPSKDVAMLMTYKLNPNMIKDFFEKFKLDGMLNIGLMMAGTSMDKITETFTGDMVFAMTDLKITTIKDSNSYSSDVDMNYIVAMGIKDNAHVEKLLGKGVESNTIVKKGNTYTMPGNEKTSLVLDKKLLVASNDAAATANYVAGKGNVKDGISSDTWKHLTSNMMGFYVDIKKAMLVIPTDKVGDTPEEKQLMTDIQNLLTYAEMYGGKMKNNAAHMQGNLYFANKEENALIQLLNVAIKAKKINDKKDADAATANTVDSTSSY
jgi:hypothetical protein